MNKLARALMALFFFCVLFCAAGSIARATTITVPSQTVPNFQARSSGPVFLRIFLNRAFVANNGTGVAGTPQQPSSPASNNYYLQLTCTLAGTTLTIPSFTIDSTTDGLDINTATYSAYFFDSTGAQIGVYAGFEQFRVPYPVVSASGCSPAGTCATWADLRAYNFARVQAPDNSAYTKSETLALINANIAGQVPITSPFWLKTPVAGLTNSVALSTLGTGLVKNTTGTGQPSIAAPDADYQRPIAVTAPLTFAADSVGLPSGNLSVGPNLAISAGSGSGALIGGGLTLSLGPNVVTQVANDTNVQGTISNGTLTFAWGGTLAKNRNLASAVYTDQSNTFGNFIQNFQAGANFLLSDPASLTKQAQFILSNITAGQVRQISFPDSNSTTVVASTAPANQFATAISAQGVVSYAPAVVASSAPANQFATAISAAGALSYAQAAFSNLSGTAAKGQLPATAVYTDQANTFGNFLQKLQAGANLSLVDPADTTKTAQFSLSNITTGQTRTVNVPDANSTTVQASTAPANQFATGVSGQGVVSYAAAVAASTAPAHQFATAISAAGALSYTQPGFADVSGVTTKAQAPATAVYTDQANTWSAGAQDLSAAGSVKVPIGAGLAPTASGLIGYDSTANDFVGGVNGATKVFADTSSAQTFANKTLTQPAIADFTNAAHNHSNATGGGQLTLAAFSSTTGSGAVVGATSPALVTPSLGAATATTVNKYTFTQPASSATLTISDGKTVTFSNTFTFNGTDGGTHTFPNNSGTVAELNLAQTWTANQTHQNNGITAQTDAMLLNNTTAANNANKTEFAPAIHQSANVWDQTPASPASRTYDFAVGGTATSPKQTAITNVTTTSFGGNTVAKVSASGHLLTTGQNAVVQGIAGLTGTVNGTFQVAVIDANTFWLVGSNITGGAYTPNTGTVAAQAYGSQAFSSQYNGAGYTQQFAINSTGQIQVGATAPTSQSQFFIGNGPTTFIDNTGGTVTVQEAQPGNNLAQYYRVSNYFANGSTPKTDMGQATMLVEMIQSQAPSSAGSPFIGLAVNVLGTVTNTSLWALNPGLAVTTNGLTQTLRTVEADLNTAATYVPVQIGTTGFSSVFEAASGGGHPTSPFDTNSGPGTSGAFAEGLYLRWLGYVGGPFQSNNAIIDFASNTNITQYGLNSANQGANNQATINGAVVHGDNNQVLISALNAARNADINLIRLNGSNVAEFAPGTTGLSALISFGNYTGSLGVLQPGAPTFMEQASDATTNLVSFSAIAAQTNFRFIRANGVSGGLTALAANQQIGNFQATGYDGAAITSARASVQFSTVNGWSSGVDNSTAIVFQTTPPNGTAQAEHMRINATGILSTNFGSAVADAATITPTGSNFHVTGAGTTITAIATSNGGETFTTGSIINIIFDSNPVLANGASLVLKGGVNANTVAGSTMCFLLDGTVWREIARSF
jgi:hypothetical protein